MEEARAVYRRACEIHLTNKPNIHMQWATFEERHGMTKHAHRVPGHLKLYCSERDARSKRALFCSFTKSYFTLSPSFTVNVNSLLFLFVFFSF